MNKILIVLPAAMVVAAVFALVFEFNAPKREQKDTITILRGENALQIAGDLKAEGYIKSKIFFLFELARNGKLQKLKSGEYDLKGLACDAIIDKLVLAQTAAKTITVVPGWTVKDIAAAIEKAEFAKSGEILAAAQAGLFKIEYDFLADAPASSTLEGYLFPDTYRVSDDPDADSLVRLMLDNFGKKMISGLRGKINKQNKTIFDIVTMASILEKEVKILEDKKIVAGILYKRIKTGMPLQADSTILYANNGRFDKEIDSRYNTYKYGGLPAGPICNPGQDSIEAAVEPVETQYWYYLSAPDGATVFSKNYDEHLANIAKYLNK